MSQHAVLRLPDDKEISLPIVVGTEGEKALDITHLRRDTGYVTLDPGYVNTGSCESTITFIDGDEGILRYRGYPIEELAERSTFLETSYLLINGCLPTAPELLKFENDIKANTMLHEDVKSFYDGFPRDAHPMAILASVVCSLSAFHYDEIDGQEENSYVNAIRLLAKVPTIVAFAYKKSIGEPFVYPRNDLGYAENFLNMTFAVPTHEFKAIPEMVDTLDTLLILHADHEQNCSTSAVRLVRSSMSNMFASITAGICALWGHRHGGANQSVIEMLEYIRDNGGNVKDFVSKVKNRENDERLMGFGHRVYKNFDPRAKIIKAKADALFKKLSITDPLLELAMELEEVALKDDFFVSRKLYPNVDFYSGIILRAMGIPVPAFPVMFALGRAPGWIAQAREFNADPANKIGRPRQIYTGEVCRPYLPIGKR
jgi:citrate synthase